VAREGSPSTDLGFEHYTEVSGVAASGKTPVGQALTLADLIGYQEGSVVSRTIIDRQVGTVTLFAFDEGQGLSEHTAPFDALVQCLDGAVEITISGRPVKLSAGQMVIMPGGEPHALKALSRFKMLLTMIRSAGPTA
jgi:quercetin dioxygenase-like cupin family protein